MSRKKRPGHGCGPRKPVTRQMLLPMPRSSADKVSLGNHLALAVCLRGTGNSHLMNELVRALYLTFYLQDSGYGDAPLDLYKKGEAALEAALSRAQAKRTWDIAPESAEILGEILRLHDAQLNSAPTRLLVDAGARLARFVESAKRSPLPD